MYLGRGRELSLVVSSLAVISLAWAAWLSQVVMHHRVVRVHAWRCGRGELCKPIEQLVGGFIVARTNYPCTAVHTGTHHVYHLYRQLIQRLDMLIRCRLQQMGW